jgi:hypothetical protein
VDLKSISNMINNAGSLVRRRKPEFADETAGLNPSEYRPTIAGRRCFGRGVLLRQSG